MMNRGERQVSILQLVVLAANLGMLASPALCINTSQDGTLRSILCPSNYSLNCLKLDMVQLVDHVTSSELQILPGMVLGQRSFNDTPVPVLARLLESPLDRSEGAERYLAARLYNTLSSLTLTLRLLDPTNLQRVQQLAEAILATILPYQTGRKKGEHGGHGSMMMWGAGTMATLGLTAIAAMSGKALASSMLALVVAVVVVLRGGSSSHQGGGGQFLPPPYLSGDSGCRCATPSYYGYQVDHLEPSSVRALYPSTAIDGQEQQVFYTAKSSSPPRLPVSQPRHIT